MSDEPSNPAVVDGQAMKSVLRRSLLSLLSFLLVLGLVQFLPGGIGWWQGWLFFAVFLLEVALGALYLWRRNPEIFVARSKIHSGTKPWDKVVMFFLLSSLMAIFPVAGLENRFRWSSVPTWGIVSGYVLFTVGMLGSIWVEAVNKFAEPSVRIQTERGHTVVDTGPYRFVRHPMYATAFLLFFGFALALGSFWALVPAAVASLVLIVRTALEDRTLQNELAGYRQYAQRVRYRLIPHVW
ncbi:MAG TPA: isoprenylcysteine carboxylmethyltransferase family protein [Pirellulales bacterium]|nr:isoprenylcysteine carboxylmethyltransferase family protein [Pirellulales bacterium]